MKKTLSKTLTEENIAFSFPLQIKNLDGIQTYSETSDGFWTKSEYDANSNQTYSETSDGYWCKREYDSEGRETYYEKSDGYWYKSEYGSEGKETYSKHGSGYWCKSEYDSEGNQTYFETSNGDKTGTPKAKHSGKVVTVDGTDYVLKEINP